MDLATAFTATNQNQASLIMEHSTILMLTNQNQSFFITELSTVLMSTNQFRALPAIEFFFDIQRKINENQAF